MQRFLSVYSSLLVVGLCALAFANQATAADHLNAIIQKMPVNSWYEVPNSALGNDPAEAQDSDFPGIWRGNNKSVNGIFPWSGGAFDTKRDRLLLWGGGHHAYYGNEIYAFNLKNFTWDRLTDPSPPWDPGVGTAANNHRGNGGTAVLSDGNPNSRHTYYNLAYVSGKVDSLFSSPGGATSCLSGGLDRNTWLFDFQAEEAAKGTGWTNKGQPLLDAKRRVINPNTGIGRAIVSHAPTSSAYDPNSKNIYSIGSDGLFEYSIENNFWRRLNGSSIASDGRLTDGGMVVDTKRNKIVYVGSGRVVVYDLDDSNGKQYQKQTIATTKGAFNKGGYRPGVNYDPVADRIVVWDGGAVHALDMDTMQWDTLAVAPQDRCPQGTYGRFRYSPSQNAYVVVNSGGDDVLIYKLSNLPNPEPTGATKDIK